MALRASVSYTRVGRRRKKYIGRRGDLPAKNSQIIGSIFPHTLHIPTVARVRRVGWDKINRSLIRACKAAGWWDQQSGIEIEEEGHLKGGKRKGRKSGGKNFFALMKGLF